MHNIVGISYISSATIQKPKQNVSLTNCFKTFFVWPKHGTILHYFMSKPSLLALKHSFDCSEKMATRKFKLIVICVVSLTILQDSNAAITPLDKTYIGTESNDVSIQWAYDNAADMETVDWSYESPSPPTTTTIMSKIGAAAATVFNNFNVEHVSDGSITLKAVRLENAGIYYCTVAYTLPSGHSTVTGTATLSITPATTTDCCCCLIDCKDIKIGVCYFANIIIYFIIFVGFSIIVGIVVEAIFNIWDKMSLNWKKASFAFFLFGLGLFICNYIKKKIAGKGDKASNVVNTGSHPDEKKKQGRPQPPPPGANHRQLPDIHDRKGRGLSANYTDDAHPLVSINIPTKKPGALESIPDSAREEVTKKKKKKKKKRVETEDDQSD